jgi:hypothetical protein
MHKPDEKDLLFDQALEKLIAEDALDSELASLLETAAQVQAALEDVPPPPHGLRPGRSAFLTAAAQQPASKRGVLGLPQLSRGLNWLFSFGTAVALIMLLTAIFVAAGYWGNAVRTGKQGVKTPTLHPTLSPGVTTEADFRLPQRERFTPRTEDQDRPFDGIFLPPDDIPTRIPSYIKATATAHQARKTPTQVKTRTPEPPSQEPVLSPPIAPTVTPIPPSAPPRVTVVPTRIPRPTIPVTITVTPPDRPPFLPPPRQPPWTRDGNSLPGQGQR